MTGMYGSFDRVGPRVVAPGEFPLWDAALALLNGDLLATLPGQEPLRLVALPSFGGDEDGAEYVHVAMSDGTWHGNALPPDSAADRARAVDAVADAAQETVSERLWQAWPLCTAHGLGLHPREVAGRLSWWCAGPREDADGHLRAAVGELDGR
ncbi:hypothetical protein AB0C59_29610 [Streptomyces sp. NPDC048664]|uniref:hypothetical protein n=1 Tax=Streptomyces sp. NPDC048664 TaxID=3154505 RepID=UPI0034438D65